MYRHVAAYHLDLGQLCTVWKGMPQDCMDRVWGTHDVPSDIKSASLEKFFPPWTVRRQIWLDALKNPAIRGCPQTSCYSATLTFRWYITTESPCGAAALCISEGLPHLTAGVCVTSNGLSAM